MGGAQSSVGNGAEHGVCGPCFAKAPFARSADPIGSPMPETPVHARRKKFAVEDAMRGQDRNNPVYSSKYSGLEKEVEPKKKESGNLAQIHEGKVSDGGMVGETPCRILLTIGHSVGCGDDVACQVSAHGSPWRRFHFHLPPMPQQEDRPLLCLQDHRQTSH